MDDFDAAFGGMYREHMFRYHDMVPPTIRLDVSHISAATARQPPIADSIPEFLLKSDHQKWAASGVITLGDGAASSIPQHVVVDGLQHVQDAPVIRFVALYDVDMSLDPSEARTFNSKWSSGLTSSTVRQY